MEYKYLSAWVEQIRQEDLVFQELLKFRDQYVISFKRTRKYLQINLASEDSFCFFSTEKKMLFNTDKSLAKFNNTLFEARLKKI
ncbi:hypothetical protein ACFLYK_04595, partial [Candidatus Cloacimonadota bacterium]